jgi:hypothetical protein
MGSHSLGHRLGRLTGLTARLNGFFQLTVEMLVFNSERFGNLNLSILVADFGLCFWWLGLGWLISRQQQQNGRQSNQADLGASDVSLLSVEKQKRPRPCRKTQKGDLFQREVGHLGVVRKDDLWVKTVTCFV